MAGGAGVASGSLGGDDGVVEGAIAESVGAPDFKPVGELEGLVDGATEIVEDGCIEETYDGPLEGCMDGEKDGYIEGELEG